MTGVQTCALPILLYNMIKDTEMIGNRKVFFVHGGTETEDREEIRRIMENENDAIVVASYGVFSTGTNVRNLHNIIFASPSKSRIRNLQSIGNLQLIGNLQRESVSIQSLTQCSVPRYLIEFIESREFRRIKLRRGAAMVQIPVTRPAVISTTNTQPGTSPR